MSFVDRFDANSYLYVTRACDYFDLADDYGGQLAMAFKGSKTRFCVVSFSSDWLYPTSASRAIVHALNAGGASVSFVDIVTDRGHDAFLIDDPEFNATAHGFLEGAARARGLKPA
jgi:homoserine O-acetyltransferase